MQKNYAVHIVKLKKSGINLCYYGKMDSAKMPPSPDGKTSARLSVIIGRSFDPNDILRNDEKWIITIIPMIHFSTCFTFVPHDDTIKKLTIGQFFSQEEEELI